jgi:hypothetical protein
MPTCIFKHNHFLLQLLASFAPDLDAAPYMFFRLIGAKEARALQSCHQLHRAFAAQHIVDRRADWFDGYVLHFYPVSESRPHYDDRLWTLQAFVPCCSLSLIMRLNLF